MSNRLSPSFRRALGAAIITPFLALAALAGSGATPAVGPMTNSLGPMLLEGISLSNFGVVDGRLYRGEQPGKQDYAALASIGVKTIIDLREDAKSTSRGLAEAAGLKYINIPIDGHGTPSDENAAAFLKAVEDESNGPVYVHCAGGRHRT